jgi:O-antigen/teichoic acid export membrane protein
MRSPSGSHGRNLAIMIAAEAVQKVLTLALFVLISRSLSVEDNGRYALFTTLFPLMVVWINMGMYDVAVRDIARDPGSAGRLLGTAEFLQMLLCIAIVVPSMLLGWRQDGSLLVSTAMVALFAANGRMSWAPFAAADRFGPPALLQVALRAGVLIASVSALWADGGVLTLVIVLLLPHALWVAAGRFWAWRAFGLCVQHPTEEPAIRYLLRQGIPIAAGGLFATLFFSMDLPLLGIHATPEQSGYYAIGARFMWMLFPVVDILTSVVYPVLSRKAGGADEGFALGRVFKAAWLLGLPMAVGGAVLAGPITVLLAGDKFLPGAYAVGGLTIALALFLLSAVATVHLRAQGRQMLATLIMAAACVAKAAFLWLSAGEGAELVGVNLVVGGLVAALLVGCAVRGTAGFAWLSGLGALLRAAAAALAMALVLWPLRDATPFLTIPLGAGVYLCAVWVLGAVDAWDRALFRAALRRS